MRCREGGRDAVCDSPAVLLIEVPVCSYRNASLYPTHVPLTGVQKGAVAVLSAFGAAFKCVILASQSQMQTVGSAASNARANTMACMQSISC